MRTTQEYARMAAFLEENGVTILPNRNAGDWSKFVQNIKGGSVAVVCLPTPLEAKSLTLNTVSRIVFGL